MFLLRVGKVSRVKWVNGPWIELLDFSWLYLSLERNWGERGLIYLARWNARFECFKNLDYNLSNIVSFVSSCKFFFLQRKNSRNTSLKRPFSLEKIFVIDEDGSSIPFVCNSSVL